jgi:prophage tail gpP-like protein
MADDFSGLATDVVTLQLNGADVLVAQSYEIRQAYFEQPASFSLTLGSGDVAKTLITQYYANVSFSIRVNNIPQFIGTTDSIKANGSGSATTITIKGRDNMAALIENNVAADTAFSEATYHDLVDKILQTALGPNTAFALRFDDASVQDNRKKLAGVKVSQTGIPAYLAELFTDLPQKPQVQAKGGENLYRYIKRELDHAGLFLYCAGDGTYVLQAPNAQQEPIYQIVRQRGALRNVVNVLDYDFEFNTTGRSTIYRVLGRGGGAPVAGSDTSAAATGVVGARIGIKGEYVDPEMEAIGASRIWVHKDKHATNSKQAEFLARKKAAQEARKGFSLTYTVSGHTVPALAGGRAVWTVDTMVNVQDDELGIQGPFWIESVERRRDMGSGTTTKLKLVRPQDLVFGVAED